MMADLVNELAIAFGLGAVRVVWQFARTRFLAWARDFALSNVGDDR